MPLLTVSEVRDAVQTDLGDTALGLMVDAADADIVERYGPHAQDGDVTLTIYPGTNSQLVYLPRPLLSVSEVREGDTTLGDPLTVNTDWSLRDEGRVIRRESTKNTCWKSMVQVVGTPVDNDAKRKMALINLVKLAAEYQGVGSRRIGDVSQTNLDYEQERERQLRVIAPKLSRKVVVA